MTIKNKLNNKKLYKIFFYISIFGLLFIFFKIYQYKNLTLKEMYIENLEEQDDTDDRQNITTQPDEEDNSPKFLELNELTIPSVKNFVVKTVLGAIKSNNGSNKQGPPGKIGPKGEKGDSGGTHTARGVLRSIKEPNLFLGRNTNKLVIGTRHYRPEQLWIHRSDGKIQSVYSTNDCLHANKDLNLELESCPIATKWKYLGKTAQIQAEQPVNGKNKCLTFKYKPENGKDDQYGLLLEDCDISKECKNNKDCEPSIVTPFQAWSFE